MQITNTANGKTAYGKVRDECMGCGSYDIGQSRSPHNFSRSRADAPPFTCTDMSPSLFEELGSLDTGVLSVSWHYENKDFSP